MAARCAAKIRSSAWDVVRAEAVAARAGAGAEAARAAEAEAEARAVCERALGALLLRQEVPDAVAVVKLGVDDSGRYDARSMARTPYGLSWEVTLEIPESHALAKVVRIDRFVERLEIPVPDEAGWPLKAPKLRTQRLRLDRWFLAELVLAPAETFMKLRAAPDGTGAGCNLWFHRETGNARAGAPRVRLEKVLAGGAAPDSPCDIDGDDAEKLRGLHDALAALAGDVNEVQNRRSPVSAKIDDTPIREHGAHAIIERLIANVAPRVDEIAKRSQAPGELVLRRRLGDNHREEVFLSKADLREKIAPLPPALRGAFAPLNLWDGAELPKGGESSPIVAVETLEPTVIVEETEPAEGATAYSHGLQ
jgi:hypothetical protein